MGTKRSQIRLSQELLRTLLFLPQDAFVFGVGYDPSTTQTVIYFRSDEVDEVPEGAEAYDFQPQIKELSNG